MSEELNVQLVVETVAQISPLLAGKPPNVQGAVLAELLALWISHHIVVPENEKEQHEIWDTLMIMHWQHVYELIEANAKEMNH